MLLHANAIANTDRLITDPLNDQLQKRRLWFVVKFLIECYKTVQKLSVLL